MHSVAFDKIVKMAAGKKKPMEARDQESNLYACEMTPNPCTRGGGVVTDNGPSSGGEVSHIYIYIYSVHVLFMATLNKL